MNLTDKWYDLASAKIDSVPSFEIDSRIKELIKLAAQQAAEEDYVALLKTGKQPAETEGDK